jgi:DNA-binding MarR family transcriptional regulator
MERNLSTANDALSGTSLRVYRYIYSHGPVRLSEVQRNLRLASSSVAEYHLRKLVFMGLIHEGMDGYEADRIIFESMIRIRRKLIPLWATLAAFLATSLVFLLTFLRPVVVATPSFLLSLISIGVSLAISLYETFNTLRRKV